MKKLILSLLFSSLVLSSCSLPNSTSGNTPTNQDNSEKSKLSTRNIDFNYFKANDGNLRLNNIAEDDIAEIYLYIKPEKGTPYSIRGSKNTNERTDLVYTFSTSFEYNKLYELYCIIKLKSDNLFYYAFTDKGALNTSSFSTATQASLHSNCGYNYINIVEHRPIWGAIKEITESYAYVQTYDEITKEIDQYSAINEVFLILIEKQSKNYIRIPMTVNTNNEITNNTEFICDVHSYDLSKYEKYAAFNLKGEESIYLLQNSMSNKDFLIFSSFAKFIESLGSEILKDYKYL